MHFESSFEQGISYLGRVDAVRQTYYVFEAADAHVIFSLSKQKINSGNFNLVSKRAVDYVYRRFEGYEEVTAKDVVKRAERTKHAPNTLAALSILYVLTASRRARIQAIGTHSQLFFEVGEQSARRQPILRKEKKAKRKARKTAKRKAKKKAKKRALRSV